MEDKAKDEELIEKLIEKRKQENDAFAKLLNAIKSKEAITKSKIKKISSKKTDEKGSKK